MQDFEGLGVFYLGKVFDPDAGRLTDDLVLYDAKDLTTHAAILGMTGSGKTGLAVGLIEEAAIDGVPTIAIDPKGDLGNLLLAFPGLAAQDFRPWIDEAEAARRGIDPDAYAEQTAAKWRQGLGEWGQDAARVGRYRDAVDAVIYTPGSTAGVPLTVLKSFSAPPEAVRADDESLRERVVSTASSLLALLGIDADPVRSREHILVSNLFDTAWREGRDLDAATLIRQIQTPPFQRLGVLDLDSFFPAKDRFALATALNGMVASPGFAAWTQGEPLDVARLLWTPEGKPRVSILSIAHLNDAERMFFVTSLLNEVIGWMRAQTGTSSLRAMLYMDEVFGFFPPSANPPSKTPMLTLLKQARAFGLGVVLASQNPVDLDYKGLGNAGTWFLGRLQTERDKARVIDGLEGASAAAARFDRARLDRILSGLKSRTFLLVNAHADAPTLFQTRWTLSYLAGPLTKPQIQRLRGERTPDAAAPSAASAPTVPAATPVAPPVAVPAAGTRPVLPSEVPERFFPSAVPGAGIEYRPTVLASARLHFVDAKAGLDRWETRGVWAPLAAEAADPWENATVFDGEPVLEREPAGGAKFSPLPSGAANPRTYAAWRNSLAAWLYRTQALTLYRSASRQETSQPGETEGDFRVRLVQTGREERDRAVDALREKYAAKVRTLEDRIRTAEERVAREKSQASQVKLQNTVSWGAAILGAVLGGRRSLGGAISKAGTAAKGSTRIAKEAQDVARAEEDADVLRQRLADLHREIEEEVQRLAASTDPASLVLAPVRVVPRKGDLEAQPLTLVWTPYRPGRGGDAVPAW
jgi:hypothetical protein